MNSLTSKIVLTLSVILSPVASAVEMPEKGSGSVLQTPMIDLVKQANNKADHEKIAARYDKEIKRLLTNSSKHEQLALFYEQTENAKKNTWRSKAASHCRIIAQKIKEVADETSALANLYKLAAKDFDK